MLQKKPGSSFSTGASFSRVTGNKMPFLTESASYSQYSIVSPGCQWAASDKVHGDMLPAFLWYWQGLKQFKSSVTWGLGSPAWVTVCNILSNVSCHALSNEIAVKLQVGFLPS